MASGETAKPAFRLTSGSGAAIDLYPGREYILGRAFTAQVKVSDGTVSAEHATLRVGSDGISIKDLGSANGTRLNGERLPEFVARENDTVGFGRASFKVVSVLAEEAGRASPPTLPAAAAPAGSRSDGPAVARPDGPGATRPDGRGATGPGSTRPDGRGATGPGSTKPFVEPGVTSSGLTMVKAPVDLLQDPRAAKLTLLLEVSQDLSRPLDTDELLEHVCDRMLTLTNVDRVAIVTVEGEALDLETKIAATRKGAEPEFTLPRSLAYTVISDLAPLKIDRGQGKAEVRDGSLMARGIWSAMCVPLLDDKGRLLGLLYVDSWVPGRAFTDDDLDLLKSFGGLVTSALRSSELVQALRREAGALERIRQRLGPNLGDEFFEDGLTLRGSEPRDVVVVEARLLGADEANAGDDGSLGAILGEFFSAMAEAVFDYGGTLDRLQGDRVVGTWGATVARSDNPDRAFAAARDMLRTWKSESGAMRHGMAIGIGMAGGKALVHSTTVGGRPWLTVVGEPVTTATRLALRAGKSEILLAASLHARMSTRPAGSRVRFARPPAVRVRDADGRTAGP